MGFAHAISAAERTCLGRWRFQENTRVPRDRLVISCSFSNRSFLRTSLNVPRCSRTDREIGQEKKRFESGYGKSRGLVVANTSAIEMRAGRASEPLRRSFPSSLLRRCRRRRFKRRSMKESIRSKLHRRFALEPIDFNIEIPRRVIDRAI